MAAKIRFRIGELEVEGEGPEEFLKEEMPKIIAQLRDSCSGSLTTVSPAASPDARSASDTAPSGKTTGAIFQQLGGGGGSKLALAAALKLTVLDGKEVFSRADILMEMKTARAHFKKSFVNNLTGYLSTLVKAGELNEHGAGTYAVTSQAKRQLEVSNG